MSKKFNSLLIKDVWMLFSQYIPKSERRMIAKKLIDIFKNNLIKEEEKGERNVR